MSVPPMMNDEAMVGETGQDLDGRDLLGKLGKNIIAKSGTYSFIMGVFIAFLVGLGTGAGMIQPLNSPEAGDTEGYTATLLVFLGLLVGIVNALELGSITREKVTTFLSATIALLVVGVGATLFEKIPLIGNYLAGITSSMLVFFAPAAVVISIKALWDLGKD